MAIDNKIKDEKLQYGINREPAKMLALSSDKIDKYQYLTGEEILLSDQSRIVEQVKFSYALFGKSFEKQIKTIEDQGIKHVGALKVLRPKENKEPESTEGIFPKDTRTNEVKDEIYGIKKWEEKIKP